MTFQILYKIHLHDESNNNFTNGISFFKIKSVNNRDKLSGIFFFNQFTKTQHS